MTDDGHVTLVDLVNASSDVLAEVEAGTLRPGDVEGRAVAVCRETFGIVGAGPADPLWSLHADICRQFLERGGMSANELAEWTAVQRRREGLPDT
jgi:hypothetical protein